MINKLLQNTCKPKSLGGKMILTMMNFGHVKLADWGASYLELKNTDYVIDIGCGGGANIAKFLQICRDGFVAGVDYSEESVKYSIKKNKNYIGKNCEIKTGNVNNIPYKDAMFDVATAFETVYFWPDIQKNFKEVNRILKLNGCFMICCEEGDTDNDKWSDKIKEMTVYGIGELASALKSAGFTIVKAEQKPDSKWICIIGKKK